MFEAGNTIVRAFIQAGMLAMPSIAILLWIALRRIGDVLLTLIPLLVAGVVTLELCVLIGLPLNFANIIALPLLLGVGVAFKIYYIMAWRRGKTDLLQIEPDARRVLQRHDHGDRVRQPVVFQPSRHLQHGETDGAGADVHDGGGGTVPAGVDGQAAREGRLGRAARRRPARCRALPDPRKPAGAASRTSRHRIMPWRKRESDRAPSEERARMSGSVGPELRMRRSSLALDNLRAFVILLVLSFHSVLAYLAISPGRAVFFRRPALSVARLSDRRQPALFRLRPVLRVAGRIPDVAVFLPFGAVRVAEPAAGRERGHFFPAEFCVSGCRSRSSCVPDAADILSDLSADCGQSQRSCLSGSTGCNCRSGRAGRCGFCGCCWWPILPLRRSIDLPLGWATVLLVSRRLPRPGPADILPALLSSRRLAYVPLAVVFTPSAWFDQGPFAFQLSRPLHYALYFFAGVGLGAGGVEHGLLAADGPLVRRWRRWLIGAVVSFVLWMALTGLTMARRRALLSLRILADLSFVLACATSCCCVLAVVLRFAARRLPRSPA